MTTAGGRAMVVTAHPDDPEFLAGGTVAWLVKEGREVTYVIVTNGNKGSSPTSTPRCALNAVFERPRRATGRNLVG